MARSKAKTVKSADQINKNWVAAMQSPLAQAKYKAGISAYGGNPMADAASPDATARYLANVQASVSNGKRANALANADPNLWKQNALNVGATGLGTGAVKKSPKQLKAMQRWQPLYQQSSQAAAAVPNDGGMNAGKWQAAVQVLMAAKGHT
jgi:hypothetical protein